MGRVISSLGAAKAFLDKQKPSAVYLVTSKPLAKRLRWAIRELGVGTQNVICVPDGEKTKEWRELEKLLKAFRDLNVDRKSVVIAFGGGTVGDVVGFAASIYLRGIQYVQVPTTLLAQVDSAHGGKTGIDFAGYKNQIGTTYDPVAIVLDLQFLKSLGREQVIDGLGEILKAGLIKDVSILSLLAKEHINTLMLSEQLPAIIQKAIRVKRWYVSRDPNERGVRRMLNFGHTIGHALEPTHHLSHGRAIIVGMLEELRITESMKYTNPSVRRNLTDLLEKLGIRTNDPLLFNKKSLRTDKKMSGRTLALPIVLRAGTSRVVRVPLATFSKYI